MTPERWQKVRDVLHDALQLAPEQRLTFLDGACLSDDSLRRDVESLLCSSDGARPSFLQSSRLHLMLKTGTELGDYELQALLGFGGMGEVYRARDRRLNREVAIKVLPSHLSSERDRLRRFEQEARAAAALNHPNILAVFQLGTYEGSPYLVSELLDGATLREQLRHGPLELDQAVDYCVQIADGLVAAHNKGIVHRDLKPENLMLTTEGRIKILDFGLAKLTLPVVDTKTLDAETDPGTVVGTLGYMSPEQALGKNLDSRTDLFSLGALLFEMVTGHRAFQGDSSAAVYDAILNQTPPSPRKLGRELPVQIENIIFKALEKNPDLRYQGASEIRADLKRLKRDMESGTAVVPSAAATLARHRSEGKTLRFGIRLGMLVLLLLLIGAGTYRFWPRSQDPEDFKVRQLTRNSSENSVQSGAISPDGKYLAYADVKGMHIQLVATGEVLEVPQPEVFRSSQVHWEIPNGWLPDSTRFIANARINWSNLGWYLRDSSVWSVSLVGTPRKIRDGAVALSVSPDGWIALGTEPPDPVVQESLPPRGFYYREIWLMKSDGEQAHKFIGADEDVFVNNLWWSPDGKRIAYLKFSKSGTAVAIETRDLDGGPAAEVFRASAAARLLGFLWLPDGRIAYSLLETGSACDHWQLRLDPETGRRIGTPKKMANWFPDCPNYPSFTADGKHVAFLRGTGQYTIYVAGLEANETRMTVPKRLTLDESRNIPSGWTPDSKTVLFISDRNGPKGIFRQSIDEEVAQSIFTQPGIGGAARLSPDGSSLIYRVEAPGEKKVMRLQLAGGVPQTLASGNFVNGGARCARLPSTVCAIAERSADDRQLVFTSLDVWKGRGNELRRFGIDPGRTVDYYWDLSPDGIRLAVLNSAEPKIHILSLTGQPAHEIDLKGWRGLGYTSWTPDGKRLVVGSQDNRGATLLSVGLEGDVYPLWKQQGALAISGIPSPDGHHIAIWMWTRNDNFWIADNL
jgi:eukaryotic-like serine/threonine-protein kinase